MRVFHTTRLIHPTQKAARLISNVIFEQIERCEIKRIFLAIGFIIIALAITSLIMQGNIWLPLMFLLGGTIGVPMALTYPFPVIYRIFIVLGLFLSFSATIYGFKNQKQITGQILAILGLIGWVMIGTVYGLSTGT